MMEKNPCQKTRKYLDEYLQDGLNQEIRAVISNHLAQCASCRQYYSELKMLNNLLAAEFKAATPVGLAESIMAAARKVKASNDLSWLDFAFKTLLGSLALILTTILGLASKGILQNGWQGSRLRVEGYFQNYLINFQLYLEGLLNFGRSLWGQIYYWPGEISGFAGYLRDIYFQDASWLGLAAILALFCTGLASWALYKQVNRQAPII